MPGSQPTLSLASGSPVFRMEWASARGLGVGISVPSTSSPTRSRSLGPSLFHRNSSEKEGNAWLAHRSTHHLNTKNSINSSVLRHLEFRIPPPLTTSLPAPSPSLPWTPKMPTPPCESQAQNPFNPARRKRNTSSSTISYPRSYGWSSSAASYSSYPSSALDEYTQA
jgi:hypothetical protein